MWNTVILVNTALDVVSGRLHVPATLPQGTQHPDPLNKELQSRLNVSGAEVNVPAGNRTTNLASSHYTLTGPGALLRRMECSGCSVVFRHVTSFTARTIGCGF